MIPCLRFLGAQSHGSSSLHEANGEQSREMESDVEDRFAAEKNEHDGAEVQNLNSVAENGTEQKKDEGTGEEVEVHKEMDEVKKVEFEEDYRMRRHSPRITLPMQMKKENEKKTQDVAGEELRRISPKFEGGGKVSKEAGETKMYLFGLV